MKKILRRHSRQRGQSMVEMALMMTILLVVLSAVLDLGRGFFSYIAINNAAAEGALYAAINPRCLSGSVAGCGNPNNVEFRTKNESPDGLVVKDNMDISVSCVNNNCNFGALTEGNPITVTVVYTFKMLGPFSGMVPEGYLHFRAHAVQKILDMK
jgi:hypothetical protein